MQSSSSSSPPSPNAYECRNHSSHTPNRANNPRPFSHPSPLCPGVSYLNATTNAAASAATAVATTATASSIGTTTATVTATTGLRNSHLSISLIMTEVVPAPMMTTVGTISNNDDRSVLHNQSKQNHSPPPNPYANAFLGHIGSQSLLTSQGKRSLPDVTATDGISSPLKSNQRTGEYNYTN